VRQPENPDIQLIDQNGEVTLYIAGAQAMQAWEQKLMHRSADLLCGYGDTFLEVGLGLGLSALRIAGKTTTKSHTVVEKYQLVIDLFLAHQTAPLPRALDIVHADIFEYVKIAAPNSFDGIFFDPEFAPGMLDDRELMGHFIPLLLRVLRPGGVFIPFFSVKPELIDRYIRFFNKIEVTKVPFETYVDTNYTDNVKRGDAFIQCFIKDWAD
jgi:predicted methyltransferase